MMRYSRIFAICVTGIVCILCVNPVFSAIDGVDESGLFDMDGAIPSANATSVSIFSDQKSVGFTGRLDSLYGVVPHQMSAITTLDLLLDVRLPRGMKAFADLGLTSVSTTRNMAADIKELFFDFNVDRAFGVRVGKQFMQWGRGYVWNPVDFLNRVPINFLNLGAIRSGVTGIRVLIPGTNQSNTYLFLDMTQASTPEEVGLLGKYEWLIGTTEVGVSTWLSPHRSSKHGVDVSTRLGDYDVIAELALEAGASWTISPLVGVTRQFHWERPNRVMFHYEAYRRTTSANTLYQAMLLTITEFPIYPLTYSLNYVQNVTDTSGIVSTGVSYMVVEGLQLSGNLLVFVGPKGGEYSPNGEAVGVLFQGVLSF